MTREAGPARAPEEREPASAGDPARLPPFAVDARDAARLASVSCRSWFRHVASGQAPAGFRLGRSRRWLVAELNAWLAAGAPPRERWDAMRAAREERP